MTKNICCGCLEQLSFFPGCLDVDSYSHDIDDRCCPLIHVTATNGRINVNGIIIPKDRNVFIKLYLRIMS
jgi:hypothetical protein